jgi:hypothetical protein
LHNATLEAVARAHPWARFADLARAVPREGRYFNDVCHLSSAGMARLVDGMLRAVFGDPPGDVAPGPLSVTAP